MRHRRVSWRLVFTLIAICSAHLNIGAAQSQSGDQFAGTWAGTWDGAGMGEFTLTLDKGTAGAITGKVDVVTDAGPYTAELKSVAFEGQKMSASYDFPLDPGSEVVMAATFDGATAKGTWSLRPKGQSTEAAGGTWTVTKK